MVKIDTMAGRPRKFDEAEVISKAMLCFWKHGYNETTIAHLEEATGLNVRSLYNAFGDKESLFLRALEAYIQMATGRLDGFFETPSTDSIRSLFQAMSSPADAGSPANYGCLMVATVFEGVSQQQNDVHARVEEYRSLFKVRFRAALKNSLPSLDEETVESRTEYLIMSLWGALTTIRLSGSTTAARPMADQISHVLATWEGEEEG